MTPFFEVLAPAEQPLSEQVHQNVERAGGILTCVFGSGWSDAVRDRISGLGNSPEWIVLADASAPLAAAEFSQIANSLKSANTALWLQPWNARCSPGLHVWQNTGALVASCWSNPTLMLAVCVKPGLINSQSRFLDSADESTVGSAWEFLVCQMEGREGVSLASHSLVSAWHNCWEEFSLRLPRLVPRTPLTTPDWLKERILRMTPSRLVPERRSDADAVAVKAGLCQWHDWLDESHQLAQSIEGLGLHRSGDYWHAIMHRREPDYANAKYWLRRLGQHSVFSQLGGFVDEAFENVPGREIWSTRLRKGGWDPFAFVDFCEECSSDEAGPLALAARQLQATEMLLLLEASYQDANSSSGGGDDAARGKI